MKLDQVKLKNDALFRLFSFACLESLGSGGTGEKPNEDLPQTESLDLLLGI